MFHLFLLSPKSLLRNSFRGSPLGRRHEVTEELFYQSGAGVPPFTLISLTERSDRQGSAVGRFFNRA